MWTVPIYLPTSVPALLVRSHSLLEEFGPRLMPSPVHGPSVCLHSTRPPSSGVLRDCSTKAVCRTRTLVAAPDCVTAMPISMESPALRLISAGGGLTDQANVAEDLLLTV